MPALRALNQAALPTASLRLPKQIIWMYSNTWRICSRNFRTLPSKRSPNFLRIICHGMKMSRKTANNPTTIWYPYCSRVIRVAVYTWLFGAYYASPYLFRFQLIPSGDSRHFGLYHDVFCSAEIHSPPCFYQDYYCSALRDPMVTTMASADFLWQALLHDFSCP